LRALVVLRPDRFDQLNPSSSCRRHLMPFFPFAFLLS
jgi:hypothetical protein